MYLSGDLLQKLELKRITLQYQTRIIFSFKSFFSYFGRKGTTILHIKKIYVHLSSL
ncbi:hypothetical protein JCM6292_709 [Bacteroides pyogenes JCM 6292]|uniref:Uncharacterized protein n=2 Tax=Bacteroides pyogenes TaxID=310300 RepID=W4PGI2_9BACE|nr:hypothetical protein JCM6292_709 [Bacteroides pyogenes JCM 6292]GAE18274.1 hypothetical protein JCM6294_1149 [Bacteroides pyogenes DSM 20611 = JCM 6294]